MKKKTSITGVTLIILALATSLIYGLTSGHAAKAKSNLNSSNASMGAAVSSAASLTTQTSALGLPNTNIYTLTSDNAIYVLYPGSNRFVRLGRVIQRDGNPIDGNLIGIDFRVADNSATSVYGVTDTGSIYLINLIPIQPGATVGATLVSKMSPRFAGGFQSLIDFNPVVNALRVIGSNDQNYAVVNSNGGNLNQTAVQTSLVYPAGDANAGVDPNITAGGYTNNFVGATNTLFYMLDYDLDTFVTIPPPAPGGSSATGGGQLQTIGRLVDAQGRQVNVAPTAGLDVYYDPATGANIVVGISGLTLFTIDLNQINPSLQRGTTQNVVTRATTQAPNFGDIPPTGGFIDVAVAPAAAAPAPAPTPTPTPRPSPTPTPVNGAKCTARYIVTGDYNVGFNATINIQNNTGVALNGWNLTWSFSGNQKITSFYNTVLTQSGQAVKANNANFNANFPNGGSYLIGFQASYSGTNAIPNNFALNGIPCVRQ